MADVCAKVPELENSVILCDFSLARGTREKGAEISSPDACGLHGKGNMKNIKT